MASPPTSSVITSSLLSKRSFVLCHFNAQSLVEHCDDVKYYLGDALPHAIAISESWLKPSLPNKIVALSGYRIYRNDRTKKRGGGVCVYLRNDLQAKILCYSSNSVIEFLFLEIHYLGNKILLGAVYKPPKPSCDFSELYSILSSLASSYTHTYITGDFNTDLIKRDSKANDFLDLLSSLI